MTLKDSSMRYRFYLCDRQILSPLILNDVFSQLDSWRYPRTGPDSLNYHIEVHMCEVAAKEFVMVEPVVFSRFRLKIWTEHGIRPEIPIKFFINDQKQPFLVNDMKSTGIVSIS